MSDILSKLKKNSKVNYTSVLSESEFFSNNKEQVTTPVPMVNVALSGSLDGGLTSGMTLIAGPSKHFKTSFALLMASAYLDKYADAALLFYDTEFGSPQSYFESFGIDTDRVIHTPVTNIEELKFDIMGQLESLTSSDKVVIVIDSIGNIASKKEVEDALNEKAVADMSRAKAIKGLFRMVTPQLRMKNLPLLCVNHTYKEQALYPKDIVSGGTGPMYSADTVWIIGRQQDKQGTEIQGYHFIIKVEKSRFLREGSKIPITVSWEGGIQIWSGLLETAMATGHVIKPSSGWYQAYDPAKQEAVGGKLRAKDTMTNEFWTPLLSDESFRKAVENMYSLEHRDMFQEDDEVAVVEEESNNFTFLKDDNTNQ